MPFKITKTFVDADGKEFSYEWGYNDYGFGGGYGEGDAGAGAGIREFSYEVGYKDYVGPKNKQLIADIKKGDNNMERTKTDYSKLSSKYRSKSTCLKIKNVIFNPPATIVFWDDGTKTVVKCQNEIFDPEKGLAMAFMKNALGNKSSYFNTVKKWAEKYDVFEATLREALKEVEKEIPNESGK